MPNLSPDILQWLYVTILAPVLGWFGGRWGTWRKERKERGVLIKWLKGLPVEAKNLLVEYHLEGTHTLRVGPLEPIVMLLEKHGVLVRGPGGGTYDAVDSYMTIPPRFWDVIAEWVKSDDYAKLLSRKLAKQRLAQYREEEKLTRAKPQDNEI